MIRRSAWKVEAAMAAAAALLLPLLAGVPSEAQAPVPSAFPDVVGAWTAPFEEGGGAHHLFVDRRTPDGPVPSVARIVRLGGRSDASDALQPFPDDAPAPTGAATEPDDTTDLTATLRQADDALDRAAGAARRSR